MASPKARLAPQAWQSDPMYKALLWWDLSSANFSASSNFLRSFGSSGNPSDLFDFFQKMATFLTESKFSTLMFYFREKRKNCSLKFTGSFKITSRLAREALLLFKFLLYIEESAIYFDYKRISAIFLEIWHANLKITTWRNNALILAFWLLWLTFWALSIH